MNYLPSGIDLGYVYTVTMKAPSITHFPFWFCLWSLLMNGGRKAQQKEKKNTGFGWLYKTSLEFEEVSRIKRIIG